MAQNEILLKNLNFTKKSKFCSVFLISFSSKLELFWRKTAVNQNIGPIEMLVTNQKFGQKAKFSPTS